jgi:DnaJ-class molecular chaperone
VTLRTAHPCNCTQQSVMGAKRPLLCGHGNLFETEKTAKPRKALKQTQRRETAAEHRSRVRFNEIVKSWPCWFQATRPCEECRGAGEVIEYDRSAPLGRERDARYVTCPTCEGDG